MPAEMSEIVVTNANNNFAPSWFQSLCEIDGDCLDASVFFFGRKILQLKKITSDFTQWPQKRWCAD